MSVAMVMANKKTLRWKVFERNGVRSLGQQATLPLRSRRQAHQVRTGVVIGQSVSDGPPSSQPAGPG